MLLRSWFFGSAIFGDGFGWPVEVRNSHASLGGCTSSVLRLGDLRRWLRMAGRDRGWARSSACKSPGSPARRSSAGAGRAGRSRSGNRLASDVGAGSAVDDLPMLPGAVGFGCSSLGAPWSLVGYLTGRDREPSRWSLRRKFWRLGFGSPPLVLRIGKFGWFRSLVPVFGF